MQRLQIALISAEWRWSTYLGTWDSTLFVQATTVPNGVFATGKLNLNVIADFRSRNNIPYYDPQDYSRNVPGMKIIPLQISELKAIIQGGKHYKDLYPLFETAFNSDLPPHEWYDKCVRENI